LEIASDATPEKKELPAGDAMCMEAEVVFVGQDSAPVALETIPEEKELPVTRDALDLCL
jgi:hypothetical protein